MAVVFTPYLRKVIGRETSDDDQADDTGDREGEGEGIPKRRLAVAALLAGVAATIAARWLRRERGTDGAGTIPDQSAGTTPIREDQSPGPVPSRADQSAGTTPVPERLRRVGKGWMRR